MPDRTINITVTAKDQATSTLKNIGKAGLGAVTGLTAAGAVLTKLAIDAAPLEGIQASFEQLAISSGSGMDEMLKALKDGSKGMISNQKLMLSFNKASQLVSTDFATRLPDAMGVLGKVSASTGEDMDHLLDSLVVGVGRLSPMILDNLGIQVDLTKAYEDYAEELGITTDEMTKSQQQTALMNQAMTLLQENTASMPDITDNATTKMAQMSASFADAKDQIGLALLPALNAIMVPLAQMAADVLPRLVSWFQDKVPIAMAAIGTFWNTTLKPAVDEIMAWLGENMPTAMQALNDVWTSVLQPVLVGIWSVIQMFIIPALSDVFNWLGEQLPVAFEFIKSVWDSALSPAFEALKTILVTHIVPALETLFGWLNDKVPEAFGAVKNVWEGTLKGVFEGIAGAILDIIGFVGDLISGIIEAIDWLSKLDPFAGGVDTGAMSETARQRGASRLGGSAVNQQHGGFWRRSGLAYIHGNEAVVPLGNQTGINALAQALAQAITQAGGDFQQNNYITDGAAMELMADDNRRRGRARLAELM